MIAEETEGKEIALQKKQTTGVTTTQDEMKEDEWIKKEGSSNFPPWKRLKRVGGMQADRQGESGCIQAFLVDEAEWEKRYEKKRRREGEIEERKWEKTGREGKRERRREGR